jgi:hypothetical protein
MTASDYDLGRQTHSLWSYEDSASRHICAQGAYKDRLWEAFKEALGPSSIQKIADGLKTTSLDSTPGIEV